MTIIKIRKDYVSDKAVLILSDGFVSFPVELSMSGYTFHFETNLKNKKYEDI